MKRPLWRFVVAALLAGAATAAVVAANVSLLARASGQGDPVGRLAPRTHLPAAPAWVLRPRRGPVEDLGADD